MSSLPKQVVVDASQAGARVDDVLAQALGMSVSQAKRLCEAGRVRRGKARVSKGSAAVAGWVLDILAVEGSTTATPVLPAVFTNAGFLVLDKPAGLASHRLRDGDPPSALEAACLLDAGIATAGPDAREGGLLHRLDVDTSGALAFARTADAYAVGRLAFANGTAAKTYLALVHGELPSTGRVDVPIAHHPSDERRAVVVDSAGVKHRGVPKDATTSWRVVKAHGQDALVLVTAQGGRRHQVRVHMAHAGAPLWGDALYGGPAWGLMPGLPGHALHALGLAIAHPQWRVDVEVPPPQAFLDVMEALLETRVWRLPA